MTTTTAFDLAALVSAIERDDSEAQASIYADDAVVELQDRDHPPAGALVVRGREAIGAMLAEVASRGLEHTVRRAVAGDSTGALQVSCRYPSGEQVTCMTLFDHADGEIHSATLLQVWDG